MPRRRDHFSAFACNALQAKALKWSLPPLPCVLSEQCLQLGISFVRCFVQLRHGIGTSLGNVAHRVRQCCIHSSIPEWWLGMTVLVQVIDSLGSRASLEFVCLSC